MPFHKIAEGKTSTVCFLIFMICRGRALLSTPGLFWMMEWSLFTSLFSSFGLSGGLIWAMQELTMSFCSQEFLCQKFLDVLYRRHETLNISNKHYTVIEDTEVTDDIFNNNSECDDDVKLGPILMHRNMINFLIQQI